MKFRGGDFSTGTMGNFQSELTDGSQGMEPQHCILCWSCVLADMQSANCRPNRATTAKTTNSPLPIMLVRL